jgi:hypothetical protein
MVRLLRYVVTSGTRNHIPYLDWRRLPNRAYGFNTLFPFLSELQVELRLFLSLIPFSFFSGDLRQFIEFISAEVNLGGLVLLSVIIDVH